MLKDLFPFFTVNSFPHHYRTTSNSRLKALGFKTESSVPLCRGGPRCCRTCQRLWSHAQKLPARSQRLLALHAWPSDSWKEPWIHPLKLSEIRVLGSVVWAGAPSESKLPCEETSPEVKGWPRPGMSLSRHRLVCITACTVFIPRLHQSIALK